jgi:hypothetical protein
MHAPLYAFVCASLVGLILTPTLLHPTTPPAATQTRRTHRALPLAFASMALVLLAATAGPLPSRMQLDSPDLAMEAPPETLARVLVAAPTSWTAWYHFGRQAFLLDTPQGRQTGERWMTQAAQYDPMNYRLWEAIGNVRTGLGDTQGARKAYRHMQELRPWKRPPPVPQPPASPSEEIRP